MKKLYYIFTLLFICSFFNSNAQFVDDMETTCTTTPWPPWWGSWSGTSADAILCSTNQAHSGGFSAYVDGNGVIDGILILDNQIFGEWYLEFWAKVPSGKSGYFNVQAGYPVIPSWCGEIYLNRDNTDPGGGEVVGQFTNNFSFPHDEWFLLEFHWDISSGLSLATWEMKVNGNVVVPIGTPYVDTAGATPAGLGGIDFFSAHATNELYLDDFAFDGQPLSIGDVGSTVRFKAYPNPVTHTLSVSAKETIQSISIYNVLGQKIYSEEINALNSEIDMDNYQAGMYFVNISNANASQVINILKN